MTTSAARSSKAWLSRNKELIEAVLTLYNSSSSASSLDTAFTKIHPRVQFIDPIVNVRGIDHYQAQFRALRWIFSSYRPLSVEISADFDKIMIDTTVEWKWWFLTLPLRQATIVHVSEGGLGVITKHEDLWSYADLWLAVPLLGSVYGWWREIQGTFLSKFILARAKDEPWVKQLQVGSNSQTKLARPAANTGIDAPTSSNAGPGNSDGVQMTPLPEFSTQSTSAIGQREKDARQD